MQVLCLQPDIVWEDKAANFEAIRNLLTHAAPASGSLVVLPEMFSTGFSLNVEGIAEGEPSECVTFLAETARIFDIWLLGGLVTKFPDGRGRNEAVVLNPSGEEVVRYAKIHPFTFGKEADFYSGGDATVAFDWQGCRVAPFICYDLRFPEIFRFAMNQGAQLFPVIANWPAAREAHWVTLLKARAVENQAYVIGVNRCGSDPNVEYSGRSMIIGPCGDVIADAGNDVGVIRADIDRAALMAWRAEFPVLRDMRFTVDPARTPKIQP